MHSNVIEGRGRRPVAAPILESQVVALSFAAIVAHKAHVGEARVNSGRADGDASNHSLFRRTIVSLFHWTMG